MARPATDIKQRVLAAARQAFAEVGFEGTSLRAVARAANTSVAMVSYHFESKDGLFRAVIDDVYDAFLADLRAIAESEPDPLLRLRALLGRMARVGPDELTTVTTVLREVSVRSERVPYIIARFVQGHGALIFMALDEAQQRGQIRPVRLPGTIPLLIAPIVLPQLISNAFGEISRATFSGVSLDAIDLVLEGLLPRPGAEPAHGEPRSPEPMP